MTNETIPLPCPFCGGNRIKVGQHSVRNEGSGRIIFNVRCLTCGAEGPDCKSRKYDYRNCTLSKEGARSMAAAAIELWNSRAPIETKTNDLPLFLAAKEAAE